MPVPLPHAPEPDGSEPCTTVPAHNHQCLQRQRSRMECSQLKTKLRLDFRDRSRCGRVMDDTDELLAQLCTRIGIMMEDASAVAITSAVIEAEERMRAILDVADAVSRIAALSDAAVSLVRGERTVASVHH